MKNHLIVNSNHVELKTLTFRKKSSLGWGGVGEAKTQHRHASRIISEKK